MKTYVYSASTGDAKKITGEIRLGVQFTNTKEVYFVLLYSKEKGYYNCLDVFEYEIGVSVGDFIGAVDYSFGVPDVEDLINELCEERERIRMYLSDDCAIETIIDKVVNSYRFNCCYNYNGLVVLDEDYKKNPLFLPYFIEVLNGVLKDGNKYNLDKANKVISALKKKQVLFGNFAKDIMLSSNSKEPLQTYSSDYDTNKYPVSNYSGETIAYSYGSGKEMKVFSIFVPNTLDDLFGYVTSSTLFNGVHYYCCPYCNRYFAYTTDTKTKYCNRPITNAKFANDIGKTCHEVGRLRVSIRNIYQDDVQKLYQKYYKKANALKNEGKIPEDKFKKWSKEARQMRDLSSQGTHPLEQFKKWLEENNICE